MSYAMQYGFICNKVCADNVFYAEKDRLIHFYYYYLLITKYEYTSLLGHSQLFENS